MAGAAVAHKHTDLELALIRLADAQAETDAELRRFAKDNREAQARLDAGLDSLRRTQEHSEANLDRYSAEMRQRQAQTEANLDRYSAEMRQRQAQTEANLDRNSAETRANLDRLSAEMREHVARSDKEWKEFRKMLGDEANRTGRLVEDVLAPSVSDLFRQITGWQGDVKPAPRQWRGRNGDPAKMREFDLVAWAGDYFLLLEAKSKVIPGDISGLLDVVGVIREYFPEAAERRVIAGIASFYMDESIVTAIERRQLLAVGLGSGLAEFLNSPGFKPTEF